MALPSGAANNLKKTSVSFVSSYNTDSDKTQNSLLTQYTTIFRAKHYVAVE